MLVGATPRFVDVALDTGLMGAAEVEAAVSDEDAGDRGRPPVRSAHGHGRPRPMCDATRLGADRGRRSGTRGDMARHPRGRLRRCRLLQLLSRQEPREPSAMPARWSPRTSASPSASARCATTAGPEAPQDRHYDHVRIGTNSRLDTIQAVTLSAKLPASRPVERGPPPTGPAVRRGAPDPRRCRCGSSRPCSRGPPPDGGQGPAAGSRAGRARCPRHRHRRPLPDARATSWSRTGTGRRAVCRTWRPWPDRSCPCRCIRDFPTPTCCGSVKRSRTSRPTWSPPVTGAESETAAGLPRPRRTAGPTARGGGDSCAAGRWSTAGAASANGWRPATTS